MPEENKKEKKLSWGISGEDAKITIRTPRGGDKVEEFVISFPKAILTVIVIALLSCVSCDIINTLVKAFATASGTGG